MAISILNILGNGRGDAYLCAIAIEEWSTYRASGEDKEGLQRAYPSNPVRGFVLELVRHVVSLENTKGIGVSQSTEQDATSPRRYSPCSSTAFWKVESLILRLNRSVSFPWFIFFHHLVAP